VNENQAAMQQFIVETRHATDEQLPGFQGQIMAQLAMTDDLEERRGLHLMLTQVLREKKRRGYQLDPQEQAVVTTIMGQAGGSMLKAYWWIPALAVGAIIWGVAS
jgi:hypothetical protein